MRSRFVLAALLIVLPGAAHAQAPDLPPITAEERALTAVPGEPNAPAVVLFRRGEFRMMGYGFLVGSLQSHLKVQARVKILTEKGLSYGDVILRHGGHERVQSFSGRTVLPDGRVVPIPADAKFENRISQLAGVTETAMAFPAVQVGAILDYQVELELASPFYFEPWYFSDDELPVRHSEIVYKTPGDWRMQLWSRSPLGVKIQRDEAHSLKGYTLRLWADDLPSLPHEPQGPPFGDLAAQAVLLPSAGVNAFKPVHLLESWPMTASLVNEGYARFRVHDEGVAQRAAELAATGTPRQRVEALYRFVRDEIRTEDDGLGIDVEEDSSLAKVLAERRGNKAGKALLLQAMLKAVRIDTKLLWAGDRRRGAIEPELPNPDWFDTVFVIVRLDDQLVFLDPGDPARAMGEIPAPYEDTPALAPVPSKPVGMVLPSLPFDQNQRRTEFDLSLDAGGRLSGTGRLIFTGHPAAEKISEPADERTPEAWQRWLSQRLREFQIDAVNVDEAPDDRQMTVTWNLTQRQDEVLGDELTLASAPLGPRNQPFSQPASERRTDVIFDYRFREETVIHLCWSAGWRIESLPLDVVIAPGAGVLSTRTQLQAAERTLVFTRRLDLHQRVFEGPDEYTAVRALFAAAQSSETQPIVLVRR